MCHYNVIITKSHRKNKKLVALIHDKKTNKLRMIHFGAEGYSDYTIHKDNDRKQRYLDRHFKKEDWNISGIYTAGFWSRWILWNKPTLTASKRSIMKKFSTIKIDI